MQLRRPNTVECHSLAFGHLGDWAMRAKLIQNNGPLLAIRSRTRLWRSAAQTALSKARDRGDGATWG